MNVTVDVLFNFQKVPMLFLKRLSMMVHNRKHCAIVSKLNLEQ